MQNHVNENNQVPIIADVDVLVCGAGPAGLGASIMVAYCQKNIENLVTRKLVISTDQKQTHYLINQ